MSFFAIPLRGLFLAAKAQELLRQAGLEARRVAPASLRAVEPLLSTLKPDLSRRVARGGQSQVAALAFGAHVDKASLTWTRQAGFSAVLTQEQLTSRLGEAAAMAFGAGRP